MPAACRVPNASCANATPSRVPTTGSTSPMIADRSRRHQPQPAEPADVGQAGAHTRDPDEAERRRKVDGRRCTLDEQRDREQHQPADDQLPGDEREHVDGGLPALDEHEPEGADQHRPNAPASPRASRLPGSRTTSRPTPTSPTSAAATRTSPARSPISSHATAITASGDVACRRGGQPARQVVGREEDQREEHPDVADPQDDRPPPPLAPREPVAHGQQHQAHGQRADGRGEQGPVGRQELLGDQVRRPPRDRGHRGDQRRRPTD